MKKSAFVILILIGFLSVTINAQETIWLNKDLKETTKNNALYYKLGEKTDGEVSYFYKNKSIFKKYFLVAGKAEGKYTEYDDSGELRVAGKYKNDVKDGNWKVYYKTGKIKKKGRYNEGDKVGIWKIFYKND